MSRLPSSMIAGIERLGYRVTLRRSADWTELRAVSDLDPRTVHAVSIDDAGPDAEQRCAIELAIAVGIEFS